MRHILTLLLVFLTACGEDSENFEARLGQYEQVCRSAIDAGWLPPGTEALLPLCERKMIEYIDVYEYDVHLCIHGGLPRFCWINPEEESLNIAYDILSRTEVPKHDIYKVVPHLQWFDHWPQMEIYTMSGDTQDNEGPDDTPESQISLSDLRRMEVVDGDNEVYEYYYLVNEQDALLDALLCLSDPGKGYPVNPTYILPKAPIQLVSVFKPRVYGEYWQTEFTVSKYGGPAKQILWQLDYNLHNLMDE